MLATMVKTSTSKFLQDVKFDKNLKMFDQIIWANFLSIISTRGSSSIFHVYLAQDLLVFPSTVSLNWQSNDMIIERYYMII